MIKDKSIFIKNIYYMLAYAFQMLNKFEYEDLKTEEFEDIHNLFASILAKGISFQLKQGLYKEYISFQENLTTMRGKINISKTLKDRIEKKQVLFCNFDELSENNIFNQVIKSTAMLILKHPSVDDKYKVELKKKCYSFQI